ncbi:hypothetical protein F5Y16DRAFT_23543 [Xylariaceae sp. FL0255]|nr:hypothetical protein F5Y16DRAFT_23543 [Xylariaceae sp. FL0255]
MKDSKSSKRELRQSVNEKQLDRILQVTLAQEVSHQAEYIAHLDKDMQQLQNLPSSVESLRHLHEGLHTSFSNVQGTIQDLSRQLDDNRQVLLEQSQKSKITAEDSTGAMDTLLHKHDGFSHDFQKFQEKVKAVHTGFEDRLNILKIDFQHKMSAFSIKLDQYSSREDPTISTMSAKVDTTLTLLKAMQVEKLQRNYSGKPQSNKLVLGLLMANLSSQSLRWCLTLSMLFLLYY